MPLSRRQLLLTAGAIGAHITPGRADDGAPQAPGLNARAMTRGRFYGAAVDDTVMHEDRLFMRTVARECGIVTGESAFKWNEVHPGPNTYNFTRADRLMNFAAAHDMQIRGHTLMWHRANPKWLENTLTPANAGKILTRHIDTVCRKFRRRITHWDVVNEVLWPQDGKPLGLRDTLWYRALGPRAIDIAFHACAEADPGAVRFINDFGMDYSWADNEAKRQAMLRLLQDLKTRGVPVQGVGMQAHLEAGVDWALDQKVLQKFCNDIAAMGLRICITEMDVRDNRLPAALDARDAAVARHAKLFLDAVLASDAVVGVLTWGLSDRRTWLNDDLPRADGLPQRPLPLDTEMRRKPIWDAMAGSLLSAPARG